MTNLWEFPYSSQRAPVLARNVVATSQCLAAQVGLQALKRGGNAVDAALATAITLTVVEPNMNGIGSDAFAILWDGKELHGLNASGRSPAAWSPERFAGHTQMPRFGWNSVTVPGAVSAWVELSRRFGKLPFADLFDAAIDYARNGFHVGTKTSLYWQHAPETFKDYPSFLKTFTLAGKAPMPGDLMKLPDHARTLQTIADTEGEDFYRGDLAKAMVADSKGSGGVMTMADLDEHECTWISPISMPFNGVELHEIPPNGQGLMALIALGLLGRFDLSQYPLDSLDSVHLQIECVRRAYAIVERSLADPEFMLKDPTEFLDDDSLAEEARLISLKSASNVLGKIPVSPDTVYLTAADESGMMVSFIQSNFRGFGSGIVVPGTGISLQNRALGFTLEAGHPNQVDGRKRPYHTIMPGFVTGDGQPLMSFGVMGGHMQAQGHVQIVVRIFMYGQNPQAASDAPRWQVVEDGQLALEIGFDAEVAKGLMARGHDVHVEIPPGTFGGAQLIRKLESCYCAASDHRKEGQAVGF